MTSPEHEQAPRAHRGALVDVDRTLLKTEAFSRHVYAGLEQMGVKPEIVRQVQQEQAETDHCFDYLARVYELVGKEFFSSGVVWQLVEYIRRANSSDGKLTREFVDDIVVDGATELMEGLQQANVATILCTSGGQMTQRLKLTLLQDALGVDLPWIIVPPDKQRKAAMAAEVYNHETRCFELNRYVKGPVISHHVAGNLALSQIRELYVIDDKWVNITDIPEGVPATGILVQVAERDDDGAGRTPLRDVLTELT